MRSHRAHLLQASSNKIQVLRGIDMEAQTSKTIHLTILSNKLNQRRQCRNLQLLTKNKRTRMKSISLRTLTIMKMMMSERVFMLNSYLHFNIVSYYQASMSVLVNVFLHSTVILIDSIRICLSGGLLLFTSKVFWTWVVEHAFDTHTLTSILAVACSDILKLPVLSSLILRNCFISVVVVRNHSCPRMNCSCFRRGSIVRPSVLFLLLILLVSRKFFLLVVKSL